jgi:hypothetical protein
VIKTEVLDRNRFASDPHLTSSLRWLTKKNHPHPIYVWIQSKSWGKNIPGLVCIVVVQFIYTCVTLVLSFGLAHSKIASAVWLVAMLAVATFNGGKYYFEVMAERHAKQLLQKEKRAEEKRESLFVISSSIGRFVWFVVFFAFSVAAYRWMRIHILQL